ncbi:FkbM family methyltransferase [Mucilaginibacter sp.]
MSLTSFIKNLVPPGFKNKLRHKLGVPSQESSFINLKNLGYTPGVVLDIGAYEGLWTKAFKQQFPEAHILMIEGQTAKADKLLQVTRELSHTAFKIELLGSEKSEVEFNVYDTASSVLKEDNETPAIVEKRVLNLLDDVVKGTEFETPDFIKIDTQGYELEILKGGPNTLKAARFVLLEVSLLNIYKNCPLVDEVMAFMKLQGFVLYDICSLLRRPYDNALNQCDFLFIKENDALRASTRWS